ncbi:1,4-beta-xylanase [Flavobacterium sp. ARAG 55.4]|uniref:1,4-beta-xylanase n=1 Tax=Flavobacterium sp. ARAG 55.4 TaxID=3451357 RepID=UPI003F455E68
MKKIIILCCMLTSVLVLSQSGINDSIPVSGRWSKEKINKWYSNQPWLVGCNYLPANSINQIEMWQASSWDPKRIDLELSWAEEIGLNTLRVFLHDLVWADDEEGLYNRMDEFLKICKKHKIKPWFVFFDDCHHPNPRLGIQPLPVKAYHNSGWNNSPARELAERYAIGKATKEEVGRLKGYVQNTMKRFKNDKRILLWELYNEPGRDNRLTGSFGDKSKQLVYDTWVWAREINPSQPITATTEGSVGKINIKINRINSDLHSVHSYSNWEKVKKNTIEPYKIDGRPILLTEWLARNNGSTVDEILPKLKEEKIGAINWGFVAGKSGTIWAWNSLKGRDVEKERAEGNVVTPGEEFPEPKVWFHDLLRFDGTPYDKNEIEIFKKLTKSN